jgi:D-ribulokinase
MNSIQRSEATAPRGRYSIGIDVGTGSARAGVFDDQGKLLATAKTNINLFRETGLIVEQSSGEIWAAVCRSVRTAREQSGVDAASIAGIGFDATCSLVVLGDNGASLPVGPSNDPSRDVIVWMDHRAVEQAERINATRHSVLKYVGGVISPEMETPKLLWLREHRPEVFDAAWQFFDLADFLTWRATGSLSRSICTLTCKWTYLGHEKRWDESYFRAIGLEVLADERFSRIGTEVVEPGSPLGDGLTERAAQELGLLPRTPVGAGLIDAHAGGIGTVGAMGASGDPTECMAYVFGTSSCTMTTTRAPVYVPGVWGPYYSAMVPGAWLNEGGQSAAGAAIDHLISLHPAAVQANATAQAAGVLLPLWLADQAVMCAATLSDVARLADSLHVVPEFLGNRAPFADPHARGLIAGLGMDNDVSSLIALYVAGLCSIGYGLRQIIETQAAHGAAIKRIMISGGAGQQSLVRQLLADATGVPVVATKAEEPVLLGAAVLGAVAGSVFADTQMAMRAMSSVEVSFAPTQGAIRDLHERRFSAFQRLQKVAREVAQLA